MKAIIAVVILVWLGTAGWGFSLSHEVELLEKWSGEAQDIIARQAETITGQEADLAVYEDFVAEVEARIAIYKDLVAEMEANIAERKAALEDYQAEMEDWVAELEVAMEDYQAEMEDYVASITFSLGEDMLVMPRASPEFDCDDSVIYMYVYFTSLGHEVRIVMGNLSMTDETRIECNHVWVWVSHPDGGEIAYDWGRAFIGEPYDFGYVVSYEELLLAASRD